MTLPAGVLLLALGADTFAVSLGFGLRGGSARKLWRVGLLFAVAEAIMPLIGWAIGLQLADWLGTWAGLLGAALLVALGLYEWVEDDDDDDDDKPVPAAGMALWVAAFSVSLDELVLGVTLSNFGLTPVLVVSWIFIQAIIGSLLGVGLGQRLGKRLAERTEKAAAAALILVGLYLAASTLWLH